MLFCDIPLYGVHAAVKAAFRKGVITGVSVFVDERHASHRINVAEDHIVGNKHRVGGYYVTIEQHVRYLESAVVGVGVGCGDAEKAELGNGCADFDRNAGITLAAVVHYVGLVAVKKFVGRIIDFDAQLDLGSLVRTHEGLDRSGRGAVDFKVAGKNKSAVLGDGKIVGGIVRADVADYSVPVSGVLDYRERLVSKRGFGEVVVFVADGKIVAARACDGDGAAAAAVNVALCFGRDALPGSDELAYVKAFDVGAFVARCVVAARCVARFIGRLAR